VSNDVAISINQVRFWPVTETGIFEGVKGMDWGWQVVGLQFIQPLLQFVIADPAGPAFAFQVGMQGLRFDATAASIRCSRSGARPVPDGLWPEQ